MVKENEKSKRKVISTFEAIQTGEIMDLLLEEDTSAQDFDRDSFIDLDESQPTEKLVDVADSEVPAEQAAATNVSETPTDAEMFDQPSNVTDQSGDAQFDDISDDGNQMAAEQPGDSPVDEMPLDGGEQVDEEEDDQTIIVKLEADSIEDIDENEGRKIEYITNDENSKDLSVQKTTDKFDHSDNITSTPAPSTKKDAGRQSDEFRTQQNIEQSKASEKDKMTTPDGKKVDGLIKDKKENPEDEAITNDQEEFEGKDESKDLLESIMLDIEGDILEFEQDASNNDEIDEEEEVEVEDVEDEIVSDEEIDEAAETEDEVTDEEIDEATETEDEVADEVIDKSGDELSVDIPEDDDLDIVSNEVEEEVSDEIEKVEESTNEDEISEDDKSLQEQMRIIDETIDNYLNTDDIEILLGNK